MIKQGTLKAGWGYYDVTTYPYGGDFKRLTEETVVEILSYLDGRGEFKVKFDDGRIGIVSKQAFVEA